MPSEDGLLMARTALLVLDMFNLFDFPDGQAMARAARSWDRNAKAS